MFTATSHGMRPPCAYRPQNAHRPTPAIEVSQASRCIGVLGGWEGMRRKKNFCVGDPEANAKSESDVSMRTLRISWYWHARNPRGALISCCSWSTPAVKVTRVFLFLSPLDLRQLQVQQGPGVQRLEHSFGVSDATGRSQHKGF